MLKYLVLRSEKEPGFQDYSDDYIAHIDGNKYEEVLAREPMEAAYRYMRRKNALLELFRYDFTSDQTDKTYAKLRVLPKDNPHEEFVTYWR